MEVSGDARTNLGLSSYFPRTLFGDDSRLLLMLERLALALNVDQGRVAQQSVEVIEGMTLSAKRTSRHIG